MPNQEIWRPEDLEPRCGCPVCSTPPPEAIVLARGDGLTLRECPRCGVLFVDPAPKPAVLAQYYRQLFAGNGSAPSDDAAYYNCAGRDLGMREGHNPAGFDEIIANFNLKGRAILDVGCASGLLLLALKKFEPSLMVGVDTSDKAIEYGRRHYGLDLRCTTIEDARLDDGRFDLVAMVDIVEHVAELTPFMTAAARCLKPNGAIYISTPNADAFALAGKESASLIAHYEHLFYIGQSRIVETLGRFGLKLKKTWSTGCPVLSRAYRRQDVNRVRRILLEPGTAAHNWRLRFKFRHASALGRAMQLNAIAERIH